MQTPKVNDKFRFDDGTIGTITRIINVNRRNQESDTKSIPAIEVNSRKFGYSTFAVSSLTLYQAPVTSNAIWTVRD